MSILTAVDIREQLDSGLTTTFLLTVSDGGEERLLARIELRYEPWDEVFYVRLGQADGTVQEVTFANFERLSRWWSTPFLALPEQARAGRRWTLTLAVIPFSFVERDDARRWLIGNPRPNVDGDTISDGGGAVMGSLLATSIRREPMLRFRWKIK